MRYFTSILDKRRACNISGLTGNCYYCTVAALLNMTTATLGASVGIMQRTTFGSLRETIFLLRKMGHLRACVCRVSPARLKIEISKMPKESALGFLCSRSNGRGHAMVLAKDRLGIANLIDYQQNPPAVLAVGRFVDSVNIHLIFASPGKLPDLPCVNSQAPN